MTNGLPVNPRASRIADMHASVPELTKRIRSIDGKQRCTSSARSDSLGVLAPNDVPCSAARFTAVTTGPNACPSSIGPHEPNRSRYRFLSAS